MQNIMLEMLHRVRMEMAKVASNRFDGFTSINYIGPRVVESGPNGPIITDITELAYRPKEILIYNSRDTHRDRKIFVIYFLLFAFLCTMLCALVHLRRYHETLQRIRMHRAEITRHHRIMEDGMDSGHWTKQIPIGTAPPSYSSPEKE
uniref:Uncharacterized protein n=1 Tax=Caenorhabditis japonica TaxID=281687 RepID=A0A8R1DMJ3_CAEJA